MAVQYTHLDPFLSAPEADAMLALAESFGSFGTYADEASSEGLGEELPQRFDVGLHYTTAGIEGDGNDDDEETAASRTNYFRETYAYGTDIQAEGIQVFMDHPSLTANARLISGCDIIVPAIVYANLLLPGQELAIHTDVPEFRGANRQLLPQWLLVCMLHSGLFARWRIPIMTCVSWFGDARGGAFTFYPDGASGARRSLGVTHNSAIILDTDEAYHGVERVGQESPALPSIGQQSRLHFCGDGQWQLREEGAIAAQYSWPELRYSISWKAYCFSTQEQEELWRAGRDQLTLENILETLEEALRGRGVLVGPRPGPTEFALMLVDHFVKYPGRT